VGRTGAADGLPGLARSGLGDAEVVPAQVHLGVHRVGECLDAGDAVAERVVVRLEHELPVDRQAQCVADPGAAEVLANGEVELLVLGQDLDVRLQVASDSSRASEYSW
jgi:hypothetical protein